ncbi:MAG: hypothetical protein HF967_04070 [Methanosarcinales archaeon]|nr:hypothetical protein [Methanosarcinales archaeon]
MRIISKDQKFYRGGMLLLCLLFGKLYYVSYHAIIMSFAKSRKYSFHASILKFIEDKTLINVSITRAKKKLILVGNSKTLCQSKLIESVICAIGKENTIIL